MHFYTYDDWYRNEYYSQDNTEIPRGNTQIIDLSKYSSNNSLYLHIRSVWRDPKFVSTSIDPAIQVQYDPIDCDLGCLYECVPLDTSHPVYKGYIQAIDNHWGVLNHEGTGIPDFGANLPYMGLRYTTDPYSQIQKPIVFVKPLSQEKFELLTLILREVLYDGLGSTNRTFYNRFQRILIYQSIYSGAVSFQDMHSRLEFHIAENKDYDAYPYENSDAKIITSLEKNDTWMIAAAMLTFTEINHNPYLIIENVSKFVYGHVDMDHQFNWNLLWKNYQPQGGPMLDSIMHFAKTK